MKSKDEIFEGKSFQDLTKSGKMVNAYNALIMASKMK